MFEGQPSSEPPERPSEAGSRKKGPKKGQVVLDLQPKPGATSLDKRFLKRLYSLHFVSFFLFPSLFWWSELFDVLAVLNFMLER